MPRHKNIKSLEVRRKELMKPLKHPHPGPYRKLYLCPVANCGAALSRRNGFIVCPIDPEHFTQEVIWKRQQALQQHHCKSALSAELIQSGMTLTERTLSV